jgi:glycosyltransferase involved in cell wall biosynthesis
MSGTCDSSSAERQGCVALRVLLWGTYDTGKPRIRILSKGLVEEGILLQVIHADLWDGIEDKSQVRGLWTMLRILGKAIWSYPILLWRLIRAPRPDIILVSYPGILDALLACCIGRLRRIPVAFDVFISLYDTIVQDRALIRPGTILARILRAVERWALRRADLIFMDTRAHAAHIEALFSLPAGSCGHVWVGAESDIFRADSTAVPVSADRMSVLFYGQYIPLHGLPVIVEAAAILRDLPIDWLLIGRGQESSHIEQMLREKPLPHVLRLPWVRYEQLRHHMAAAHVCLGIFGNSQKAASVIPNKVFQLVAAGRPLITRDSAAIRELFDESNACHQLVPAGDAAALAAAVERYFNSGFWREARSCHQELQDRIFERPVARQFISLLQQYLSRS